MVTFRTKKLMVTVFAAVSLLFVANGATAELQAAEAKQQAGSKSHKLPATLETTQWGWLDPNEPPKLTVDSGDTISIETDRTCGLVESSRTKVLLKTNCLRED